MARPTELICLARAVRQSAKSRCTARIAIGVLLIASSVLLVACHERNESFYPSLADAIKAGEITRGWLPDFLPGSTRAIHISYDPSSPRTWCAFDFSPDDSQRLRQTLANGVDALPVRVRHLDDPGVSWWPELLKGDLDVQKLHGNGFVLYTLTEPDVESKTRLVLFAIDSAKGRGFFYRTPGQ